MDWNELCEFSKGINAKINSYIKAWENTNDSTLSETTRNYFQEKYDRVSDEVIHDAKEVFPSVEIDFLGLYPSYKLNGYTYYTIESLCRNCEIHKIN